MDKHVFTDKQKKLIAWAAIAIFLLLSAAVGWFIGRPLVRFASRPEEFRLWVDGHGLLGMAAYVGMVFLQVVVAVIPGEPLEISGGSSPTGKYVAQSGQADEIRPGTYVFSDYMMYKECGAPLENVSARLVVTVVSVHKDYVVVDGGCKTFATDPQLDQPPYFFEGYAWFPQYPELRIRRLTEEHGMVTAEGPMPELKVGDMLEAIPVHICPTVNLQNQIYVADGGVLRTEIVAGRGKLQ
jgi:hypothetical protein